MIRLAKLAFFLIVPTIGGCIGVPAPSDVSGESERATTDQAILQSLEPKSLEEKLGKPNLTSCEWPDTSHLARHDALASCIRTLRTADNKAGGTASSTFSPRCLQDGDKLGCNVVAVGVTVSTKTEFALIDDEIFKASCPGVSSDELGVDFQTHTVVIAKLAYPSPCSGGNFVAWPSKVTAQNAVATIEAIPTADQVEPNAITCACNDRVQVYTSAVIPKEIRPESVVLKLK